MNRILIIGDIVLDRYIEVEAAGMSPEASAPLYREIRRWEAPGGAAKVADNVLRLGMRFDLIGTPRPFWSIKTRLMKQGEQVLRLDEDKIFKGELLSQALGRLTQASAVVFADYGKGVATEILAYEVIAKARELGIPTVADPKYNAHKFLGVTVLKPNAKEAKLMSLDWETSGADHLLVTRGSDGMLLDDRHAILAEKCEVVDIVGAGDAVAAALAVALSRGDDILSAACFANSFAAEIISGQHSKVVKAGATLDSGIVSCT